MNNKRGDVAVTIFVIGVVALCFFALISFYISSLNSSDNFKGISLMEKVKIMKMNDTETNFHGKYREMITEKPWGFGEEKMIFSVVYSK